jgi:hypothetical protein
LLKYAIVKNGIIENVIVADAAFIEAQNLDAIECPEGFGVGDGYANGEFFRITAVTEADELEII